MLERLGAAGFLSPLDVHFAGTIGRIGGDSRPNVLLAAALASQRVSSGHVCLHLARLDKEPMPTDGAGAPIDGVAWPAMGAWLDELRSSPLVATTETDPVPPRPLVLDRSARLYLWRYWEYERQLAEAIEARASAVDARVDVAVLEDGLQRLFRADDDDPTAGPDWQRLAAQVATRRLFAVISGGPGTGKTHTVVKILALLIEQALAAGRRPPRIHLVAPTGKAAARLAESVRREARRLDASEEVRREIPAEASTIHRCLGASLTSDTRFRHHAENPLVTDLVLVDEASMVDVALMARLVAALPAAARLILLGDKDQLASVEAGAVLGEICNTGAPESERRPSRALVEEMARITGDRIAPGAPAARSGLGDCIVELRRSYRYGAESGIGRLAAAIKEGRAEEALGVLLSAEAPDVALAEPPPPGELGERLHAAVLAGYAPFLGPGLDAEARIRAFDGFRVLSAHRGGPRGVETLNRQIEEALAGAGWIRPRGLHYAGRPILVTRNDYLVGLFNGDVGLVEEGPEGRFACFAVRQGEVRRLSPSRLPPHETAFAMTIHRSQGSEFDEVAVLLPETASPIVTRELLYTAVTRARRKVTVYAAREIVSDAIERRTERASGLAEALWG